MTLPDERYRAVQWAARFLREVATDRTKYPRVPLAVRREALSILRHYPSTWDMDRAAVAAPSVFQSANTVDPLALWIINGEEKVKNQEPKPVDSDPE